MRLGPTAPRAGDRRGGGAPSRGELADEQLEQVAGGLSLPGFGKVVINYEEQ
jgi:hypothetical protein